MNQLNSLLDSLQAQEQLEQQQALARFDQLAEQLAAGDDATVDAAEVGAILKAAGKSAADLQAEVSQAGKRVQWRAALASEPALLEERKALQEQREQINAAYSEAVRKYEAGRKPVDERLDRIANELNAAMTARGELNRHHASSPRRTFLNSLQSRKSLLERRAFELRKELDSDTLRRERRQFEGRLHDRIRALQRECRSDWEQRAAPLEAELERFDEVYIEPRQRELERVTASIADLDPQIERAAAEYEAELVGA